MRSTPPPTAGTALSASNNSATGFVLAVIISKALRGKRTILFAEHLTNEVLLKLPHRQFVFTKDAFASRWF